jgi:hypothetical protein
MCNCGNKRNGFANQPAVTAVSSTPAQQPAAKMWEDIPFMYTGQSALTITGYISGKRYRFSAPGEKQLIDYRDAAAMMNVPALKKV